MKNTDAGIRLVLEEIRDLRREIAEDRRLADIERRKADAERRKADEAWQEERRRADERFDRMFRKTTVDSAKRERGMSRALVIIGNLGRELVKGQKEHTKLLHQISNTLDGATGGRNGHRRNGRNGNGHK